MKILLSGGGSIGHVAPCVAVAHALREQEPGMELHFLCSDRPEEQEFLRKEGLPFTPISLPRRSWKFPFIFFRALREAGRALDAFRPDAIFSKGGAVSVPVALAARRRRIPIVLHESDAVMGRANRLIAKWAKTVCTGMPLSYRLSPATYNIVHTGNPIRPALTQGSRLQGLAITGLPGKKPVLLVIGGSQGAQALNEVVTAHLDALLQQCDIIHITGPGKAGASPRPGYWSCPFAQEYMPHLFATANLALSRSGASVITELAANGIPTILVPLRGVAQDHQETNARAAEKSGGCIVMEQKNLPAALVPTLTRYLKDKTALATMGEKMRTLYRPEAAKEIANILSQARK